MLGRRHREAAQGMAEYAGLVVLVAGAIVALPMAGIGDELARRFRCAVTAVTFGEGSQCAEKGRAAAARPEMVSDGGGGTSTRPSAGPTDGPGLSRRTIPVLRFPGALSVTSSVGDYVDEPFNLPVKGGIVATTTTVVERTPPKLVRQEHKARLTQRQRQRLLRGYDIDRDTYTRLEDMQTLKISTELVSTSRVEIDGGKISVAKGQGTGTKKTYQITVPQEYANAMEKGKRPAPNPHDPRSIPKGSSVLMSQSYFSRNHSEMELSVLRNWAFGMESTNNRGRKISSMVQRIDADEVRIVVGDAAYVENVFKAGVSYSRSGPEDRNSVSLSAAASSTDTVSSGEARQIVLEIDTRKGWKKYQHFVKTGKLPTWSGKKPDYVTSSSRVETVKTSSKASLEAEVEAQFEQELTENFTLRLSTGASYSLPLGKGTSSKKSIERKSDGTVEITTQRRNERITWTATQKIDKSGTVKQTSYRMLLDDVEPRWASQYSTANSGNTKNYTKKKDIALRFNGEDLDSLQQDVYEHIAQRCRMGRCHSDNAPTKASDVRKMLHGNESADGDNLFLYPGSNKVLWTDIAHADNRREIVQALSGHQGWSNNQTLDITSLARRLCTGPPSRTESSTCKPDELAKYVPGEVEAIRSDS